MWVSECWAQAQVQRMYVAWCEKWELFDSRAGGWAGRLKELRTENSLDKGLYGGNGTTENTTFSNSRKQQREFSCCCCILQHSAEEHLRINNYITKNMGNSLGFIVTWMKSPSTIMCFSSDVVKVQLLWTVVKMAGQGSREMAQRLRVTVNQLQRTGVQFSNTLISQFTTACNSNSREPDTSDGLCALNTNKRLPFKNRAGQILPEWLYRERDGRVQLTSTPHSESSFTDSFTGLQTSGWVKAGQRWKSTETGGWEGPHSLAWLGRILTKTGLGRAKLGPSYQENPGSLTELWSVRKSLWVCAARTGSHHYLIPESLMARGSRWHDPCCEDSRFGGGEAKLRHDIMKPKLT